MITRRTFVTALGAGALAGPLPCVAQKQKVPVVGYLANDPRRESPTFVAFKERLAKLGWIEGQNITIKYESPDSDTNRGKFGFKQLAEDFVRSKVDVIVATGTPSTREAMAATQTIPIVFGSALDPVGNKFVNSLPHPGGNVTGLALLDLGPKRLEFLKQLFPRATRFVRVYHEGFSTASLNAEIMSRDSSAAAKLGVQLQHKPVDRTLASDGKPTEGKIVVLEQDPKAIEKKLHIYFSDLKASGAEAIYVKADAFFVVNRERICRLALEHRLPMMGADERFANAGALISYGENFPSRYAKAAELVDRILKGANPATTPVEQTLFIHCVVNLGTAKTLGVSVPQSVLDQADKVIE